MTSWSKNVAMFTASARRVHQRGGVNFLTYKRAMKLLAAACCLASAAAQPGGLVPSGGMVPGGGGGGRRHGGYVRVSEPPLGFFIAGSSLHQLNGVYGPRLGDEQLLQFGELQAKVRHGLYRGENGWMLAHVASADADKPGAEEWVFIDETWRDRFVHAGDTLIPGSGPRWKHVSREPRPGAPPTADGGASSGGGSSHGGGGGGGGGSSGGGGGPSGGEWHGGSQVRAF